MTQALNDWKERFADLIEAARRTDDLGDAERDQLIAFIAREALRILDSPHPQRTDAWSELGYRR